MNKILAFAITSALMAAITGCDTTRKNVTKEPETVSSNSLNGTKNILTHILPGQWYITSVQRQQVEPTNEPPYVIFDGDHLQRGVIKAYACDGCNIINGAYNVTIGGHMTRSGDLISTMRLCPDAPYEMGINLALNDVANYVIEKSGNDYTLQMFAPSGNVMMQLRKYDLGFINGAWKVIQVGRSTIPDDVEVELVFDTPGLRIHGQAGCNTINGDLVINPSEHNALRITDLRATRMTCPYIEIEQQLLEALNQTVSVSPFLETSGAYLCDADGNHLVTMRRIATM